MPVISERARAKVNLTLKVLGRRPDGYHEIESLVAFADVADVITLDLEAPVGVSVIGPFGPSIAGDNLIRIAIERAVHAEPSLRLGAVSLEKNLPIAAGIGGGSADAAAVLRAVRTANADLAPGIDWPMIASSIGADVPVCLHNRAAIMRGTGERLQQIENLPLLSAVLVNPQVPVPADKTARVFRTLSAKPFDGSTSAAAARDRFNDRNDLLSYMAAAGNGLAPPAMKIVPEIALVMEALSGRDGIELAAVSGGGPTCFGIFSNDGRAEAAAAELRVAHPAWWIAATRLSG